MDYPMQGNNTNGSSPSSNGKTRPSIQNALSGLSNPSSFKGYDIGSSGRSHNFYGGSYRQTQTFELSQTPAVHSDFELHEQTAELADIGVPEIEESGEEESSLEQNQTVFAKKEVRTGSPDSRLSQLMNESRADTKDLGFYHDNASENEISPNNSNPMTSHDHSEETESYKRNGEDAPLLNDPFRNHYSAIAPHELRPSVSIDLENGLPIRPSLPTRIFQEIGKIDKRTVFEEGFVRPVSYFPAVFLGVLLNILDGLSYGMIMFPIGETVFSGLGPTGLSMFYMSCVISQLIYSLGGSAFKSGIGSEMIEVTPFFHAMALSILGEIGEENSQEVISTTIVAYALSSIVTGAVFFILGKCKLGSLVGFFPRHILVGCIGGVGYFLVVTGIEVSSRLEGGIQYNLDVLRYLFQPLVLAQWGIPLILALVLITIQRYSHNALIVPAFFIAVFVTFQSTVLIVPSWDLNQAREYGWVFTSPPSNEPWYAFYSLYNFNLVDWMVILQQVPKMLALTFFGILHVPINVPALAVTVGMDEYDVDRELIAHGASNALSGLCGSIQNYLVYTNSVLFIRAGADSRLSGVMLAVGTALVMFAGPVVIGYIPVCVVGALIYLLGYELLKEALYDTYGRLSRFEYLTVIIIVITMGAWDFVYGIAVGILLACISFVIESARRPVIAGIFTGNYARSSVLRHPKQQEFLRDVGHQIYILKLQGSLFFGSIGGLEKAVRQRFDEETFDKDPIKYLVLDMKSVLTMDFSAAECFRRLKNLIADKDCFMMISSVEDGDDIVTVLEDAGLFEDDDKRIQLFNDLNSSLEWCENNFLRTYSVYHNRRRQPSVTKRKEVPMRVGGNASQQKTAMSSFVGGSSIVGSPRQVQIVKAAKRLTREDLSLTKRASRSQPPLPLILTILQSLSTKDEAFWAQLAPFFTKEFIAEDTEFYSNISNLPQFYLVESGLIRATYDYDFTRKLSFSILPLTAFGDLSFNKEKIQCTYTTMADTVVWRIADMGKLKKEKDLFLELQMVETRLLEERFDSLTSNLIVAGQ